MGGTLGPDFQEPFSGHPGTWTAEVHPFRVAERKTDRKGPDGEPPLRLKAVTLPLSKARYMEIQKVLEGIAGGFSEDSPPQATGCFLGLAHGPGRLG